MKPVARKAFPIVDAVTTPLQCIRFESCTFGLGAFGSDAVGLGAFGMRCSKTARR